MEFDKRCKVSDLAAIYFHATAVKFPAGCGKTSISLRSYLPVNCGSASTRLRQSFQPTAEIEDSRAASMRERALKERPSPRFCRTISPFSSAVGWKSARYSGRPAAPCPSLRPNLLPPAPFAKKSVSPGGAKDRFLLWGRLRQQPQKGSTPRSQRHDFLKSDPAMPGNLQAPVRMGMFPADCGAERL